MLEYENTVVVASGDLIRHALSLGYEWNQANRILVDDVVSHVETGPQLFLLTDFEDPETLGMGPDAEKIMTSFFAAQGIDEFMLMG